MIEFVLAATLLFRDPPGDAVGTGSLTPPTAEQYRNVGSFDLLDIEIPDTTMLSLRIEMGALPNPAGLANGFSNAIIDVYIDTADGGQPVALPGPQMQMPSGRGWEYALRIHGDGATAYRADDAMGEGAAVSYPVQVDVEDRVIIVSTPFERPDVRSVYAMTGVYDPFVASGWRPLAESASPWAFSSANQRRPVVDVLARDLVAQAAAIREGVLPLPRNRIGGAMWMILMALGLVVAGVGLVLRRWAGAGRPTAPTAEASGEVVEHAAHEAVAASAAVALPTFLPALPAPAPDAQAVVATEPTSERSKRWSDDVDADWRNDATDEGSDDIGQFSEGVSGPSLEDEHSPKAGGAGRGDNGDASDDVPDRDPDSDPDPDPSGAPKRPDSSN